MRFAFPRSVVRFVPVVLGLAGVFWASAALASEAISYVYDARGRLVSVVRSGSINNGVSASYAFDRANNRTQLVVSGSSGSGGGSFSAQGGGRSERDTATTTGVATSTDSVSEP